MAAKSPWKGTAVCAAAPRRGGAVTVSTGTSSILRKGGRGVVAAGALAGGVAAPAPAAPVDALMQKVRPKVEAI